MFSQRLDVENAAIDTFFSPNLSGEQYQQLRQATTADIFTLFQEAKITAMQEKFNARLQGMRSANADLRSRMINGSGDDGGEERGHGEGASGEEDVPEDIIADETGI
jgi:hypothetical protein